MFLICSPPHQFFIVKFFHQHLVGGKESHSSFWAFSKYSIQSSKSPTLSPPYPNPSVYATFSNVMWFITSTVGTNTFGNKCNWLIRAACQRCGRRRWAGGLARTRGLGVVCVYAWPAWPPGLCTPDQKILAQLAVFRISVSGTGLEGNLGLGNTGWMQK